MVLCSCTTNFKLKVYIPGRNPAFVRTDGQHGIYGQCQYCLGYEFVPLGKEKTPEEIKAIHEWYDKEIRNVGQVSAVAPTPTTNSK